MPLVTVNEAGKYQSVAPVLAAGQPTAFQFDANGNLRLNPYGAAGSCKVSTAGPITGAAGAPSVTVPAGKKWLVMSVTVVVANTAVAGSRQVAVKITNGTTEISHTPASTQNPTPSTTVRWTFGPSIVAQAIVNGNTTSPMPSLVLGPGYVIFGQLETGGDAGDTTTVAVNYIEYSD